MATETFQEITDKFQSCLSLAKLWSEFCIIMMFLETIADLENAVNSDLEKLRK